MEIINNVTFEELKSIFASGIFREYLRRSNEIMEELGHESMFFFRRFRDFSIDSLFPESGVEYTSGSAGFMLKGTENEFEKMDNSFKIVDYHMHPKGIVCPSEDDNDGYYMQKCFEYNMNESNCSIGNPLVKCIGASKDCGKIHEILLMQNQSEKFSNHEAGMLDEMLQIELGPKIWQNEAVAAKITGYRGWQAELIRYSKKGKNYMISKRELDKLGKFAYSLKGDYSRK